MEKLRNRFIKTCLIIGVIALMVPASLVIAPRPAHAFFGLGDIVNDPINGLILAAQKAADIVTSGSVQSLQLKEYVLDPIVRLVAQTALRSLTASIINEINGQNGSPQFVQNLAASLQQAADTAGLAFITEFGNNINSPFATAIAGTLYLNYIHSSSLAGFMAANQCTLQQFTPNIRAYLSGNWHQGGWSTWFALTTQDNNNPYIQYHNAMQQLASVINSATGNLLSQLGWGQGFLSWCGTDDTSSASSSGSAPYDINNLSTADAQVSVSSQVCLNKDGTPGHIQTPGSVIAGSLNKALGAPVDSLVSAHEIDESIDAIFGALVTKILGGTGLFGASHSSGSQQSLTTQVQSTQGSTADGGSNSVANNAITLAQSAMTQADAYTSAWQAIIGAANTASSTLQGLAASCSAQASAAQGALATQVAPLLTQGATALTTAATTKALALRVQQEAVATTAGSAGALAADVQALSVAPPSAVDVADAQSDATATGAATSSANSLAITGGTSLDRMTLLTQRAQSLAASCSATPTQ